MSNSPLGRAVGAGTVMQVAMVVIGHFVPSLQEAGLFPIGGTLIGLVTGWLAGRGSPPGTNATTVARDGGIAGGVAGVLGSLVSTALGDVPLVNMTIAGGSTLVTGALGGLLARAMGKKQ
jgi:hypothetical protein